MVFAHDLQTLTYFLQRIDRPSGAPAPPTMIAEGIVAVARSPAIATAAKAMPRRTLALGPEPLDAGAIQAHRFAISELAAALQPDRDRHVRLAAGAALYGKLADFTLRASGHWSGPGKALPRALSAMDPGLAQRFEAAFVALFTDGDAGLVQALIDDILARHGGRLRDGFRQSAAIGWREPPAS